MLHLCPYVWNEIMTYLRPREVMKLATALPRQAVTLFIKRYMKYKALWVWMHQVPLRTSYVDLRGENIRVHRVRVVDLLGQPGNNVWFVAGERNKRGLLKRIEDMCELKGMQVDRSFDILQNSTYLPPDLRKVFLVEMLDQNNLVHMSLDRRWIFKVLHKVGQIAARGGRIVLTDLPAVIPHRLREKCTTFLRLDRAAVRTFWCPTHVTASGTCIDVGQLVVWQNEVSVTYRDRALSLMQVHR